MDSFKKQINSKANSKASKELLISIFTSIAHSELSHNAVACVLGDALFQLGINVGVMDTLNQAKKKKA
jgi:hypothetical protein